MTSPVLIVTGTDTEVGKTVATAAICAALGAQGMRVHVVKPTQTGLVAGEPGDVDEVNRLAAPAGVRELVRLPDPLAPDVAARRAGLPLPNVASHAARVARLAAAEDVDVVVVEGAGGLLVNLDADGHTLADLGLALRGDGVRTGFVVVCREGLGTLNHTALTLEALEHRGLDLIGLIIGSATTHPDLADRTNHDELARLAPLLGVLPAGAATMAPARFREAAAGWIRL